MTNHWNDLANSDCLMIIGCNPAENHPISFKWITKAQEKGAKLIVVDPRFTRSAAKADLFVRLRPGTDIALMGGLIHYILENNLFHRDYVVHYTNAAFLVHKEFAFGDGLFTGYQKEKRAYNPETWSYELDAEKKPVTDPTLTDPRCVFQIVKAHFARYTPELVEAVTGIPQAQFAQRAALYCATGAPGKAGTILYAMGGTQHSTGVQIIRSYAILQQLLGNMGLPGGGINALRGENNVQGSTDMALLFHIVPGYMAIPSEANHPTLKDYLDKETPKASYWMNKPKFFVSLLKAFWGDAATKDNDFAYDYLPKIGKGYEGAGYSWIPLFEAMGAGRIKGMLVWGMNPAVSSPNLNQTYEALDRLEWLAAFDLWETDTAVFWQRPGADPKKIKTEVFMFPAADSLEKEGSASNSGRWLQWRYQAVKPHGDAKSDLWYANRLGLELIKLYKEDAKAICPEPMVKLAWSYGEDPDVHLIAKEVNGYTVADKKQVPNFTQLADDGTTACGCWIYSGSYPGPEKKDNLMARRHAKDDSGLMLYPTWAWAWPVNRRIIYNRCSLDPQGQPWSPHKAMFKWDEAAKTWKNFDVPDFGWLDPKTKAHIPPEVSAKTPFIMLPEGKSRLFVPAGVCKEGPLPEHYEPLECAFMNAVSPQQSNPAIKIWASALDRVAELCDPRYPVIATTLRLTEHWQGGAMTRNLDWQNELFPEMFVEISPSLAKAKGIKAGDWVTVKSVRGEVRARANVTARVAPFTCGKPGFQQTVELVALPWHFGFAGGATGGPPPHNYAANQLAPQVGDANTMIPEYKVFLVDVVKA
ncbi:MAG: formate dehydrogenase-N subunit alpha [Desulfobacca sp. RBG_16_58_9]|nr:MAG: formate dehydrogenase-N subunit alpha [Desulfobacca sp. RBG_16_58_9]